MLKVLVTIRSLDDDVPPHKIHGLAPTDDCALAVTRSWTFTDEKWNERDRYMITHRPTGYSVSKREWSTQAEAIAVLERCDPLFPAWALAIGNSETDAATKACFAKFRNATQDLAA